MELVYPDDNPNLEFSEPHVYATTLHDRSWPLEPKGPKALASLRGPLFSVVGREGFASFQVQTEDGGHFDVVVTRLENGNLLSSGVGEACDHCFPPRRFGRAGQMHELALSLRRRPRVPDVVVVDFGSWTKRFDDSRDTKRQANLVEQCERDLRSLLTFAQETDMTWRTPKRAPSTTCEWRANHRTHIFTTKRPNRLAWDVRWDDTNRFWTLVAQNRGVE